MMLGPVEGPVNGLQPEYRNPTTDPQQGALEDKKRSGSDRDKEGPLSELTHRGIPRTELLRDGIPVRDAGFDLARDIVELRLVEPNTEPKEAPDRESTSKRPSTEAPPPKQESPSQHEGDGEADDARQESPS